MAAASGSAPDSPRLQRGADLSQLHSRGPSAWFRAMVGRLSGGCSAIELQRIHKVVARGGNAPPYAECESAALLLSYRAVEENVPAPGYAPGFSMESRMCCYCTIRARRCLKWLPGVDSHHDTPLNRRACSFDIIGEEGSSRLELHRRSAA